MRSRCCCCIALAQHHYTSLCPRLCTSLRRNAMFLLLLNTRRAQMYLLNTLCCRTNVHTVAVTEEAQTPGECIVQYSPLLLLLAGVQTSPVSLGLRGPQKVIQEKQELERSEMQEEWEVEGAGGGLQWRESLHLCMCIRL